MTLHRRELCGDEIAHGVVRDELRRHCCLPLEMLGAKKRAMNDLTRRRYKSQGIFHAAILLARQILSPRTGQRSVKLSSVNTPREAIIVYRN